MRGKACVFAEEVEEAGPGIPDLLNDLVDLEFFGIVLFNETDGVVHEPRLEFPEGLFPQLRTTEDDVLAEDSEMAEVKGRSFVGRSRDDGGDFLEVGLYGTTYDKWTVCGSGQQVEHVGDVRIRKGGVPAGLWRRSHVQDDTEPRLDQSAAKGVVRIGGNKQSEPGLERDGVPPVDGIDERSLQAEYEFRIGMPVHQAEGGVDGREDGGAQDPAQCDLACREFAGMRMIRIVHVEGSIAHEADG